TRVASSVAISLNTAAIAALVLVPVAIGWALLRRAPLGTDEVPPDEAAGGGEAAPN
ncbi:MAG: hypothetical protein IT373_33610, partial [Polyangiaceae bacterium]|nr:hypothetical protein [Polyangiaceae bacterium]